MRVEGKFRHFGNFDFRLFFTLIALMAIPMAYTIARIFWLGEMPDDWGFNIASQIIFIHLIFEVIEEGTILPLFNRLGLVKNNRLELGNRMATGLLVVLLINGVAALAIGLLLPQIAVIAHIPSTNFESILSYIRIELVALIFIGLNRFMFTLNIATGRRFNLWAYLILQTILTVLLDAVLMSSLPFSLGLGVNGIAISNIIVNLSLFVLLLFLFLRQERLGCKELRKSWSFDWLRGWIRQGAWAGGDSLIRNAFYFYMIASMMNVVAQQGNYWVANQFIWGILLLPVLALGQQVKMETAGRVSSGLRRSDNRPYFILTLIVIAIWLLSFPLWQGYYTTLNNVSAENIGSVMWITIFLLPAYVFFAFNNVADSVFYGTGKTHYMFIQAVITNFTVYGAAFVLYVTEIWVPTLETIALLFAIGVVVDSLITFFLYFWSFRRGLYEADELVAFNE